MLKEFYTITTHYDWKGEWEYAIFKRLECQKEVSVQRKHKKKTKVARPKF